MINQFAALERRVMPGGLEKIDHPARGGADDISNSVAGVLVSLSASPSSADNWLEFYRRENVRAGGLKSNAVHLVTLRD